MTKKELKDLKSSFIRSYVDDYTMETYHSEMINDLDNLCKEFAKHQNEELLEEVKELTELVKNLKPISKTRYKSVKIYPKQRSSEDT